MTDCARTADTQISMYILWEIELQIIWISTPAEMDIRFLEWKQNVHSCALQTSMVMYFFDAWPKINFWWNFHGKFGCFEMENQQNRWHSSIVTSYSPEWFLVKDLCTWYKSEAHSCRPNHGLFTLIKFGIAALPLRTWRHYHFLHWCFLSCIHLNISKILIKMVIKLWTKDIRYVFGWRENNLNNNKKKNGQELLSNGIVVRRISF